MNTSVFGAIIFFLTAAITYKGFKDRTFFKKYKFHVDRIVINKENFRTITSGFLHGDWIHFLFNMMGLLSCSASLEWEIGIGYLAVLYFASILGGNLLSLYAHWDHGNYSSIGASGGVCGLVFATIVVDPFYSGGLIYGITYIAYTIYAVTDKESNIGHIAHTGGALTGIVGIVLIKPIIIFTNWWVILLLILPILLFIIVLIKKPELLNIENKWGKGASRVRIIAEKRRKKSLNDVLNKVSKSGIHSLTYRERMIFENHKRTLR